jgi:hypothetical protein
MNLLVCNIHLNPLLRLNIRTTLNKFDSIIDCLTIQDWSELIDGMND